MNASQTVLEADEPPADTTPHRPDRRAWWVTFALVAALGMLWALANPLFSVPDEPVHTLRAVGAARGQFLPGDQVGSKSYNRSVEVPEVFAKAGTVPMCYAFQGDIPAGCAPSFSGSDDTTEAITTAGLYPPAYYFVVGLPSLVFTSATGVYLMRFLSVAICAAFVASAVSSVSLLRSPRLAIAGIAVAVTPELLFLAGSINPNGVEIAAAVGLWASLAVLLLGPPGMPTRRLLVRVAVAGAALALSRPGSPTWVLLIGVFVALWAGVPAVRDWIRDRSAWIAAGVVGVACVATLAWITAFDTLSEVPGGGLLGGTLAENVRYGLGTTPTQVEQMIAVFGWLDTGPAMVAVAAWLFAVGCLVLVAVAVSPLRQAATLGLLVAAVVLVPILLQLPNAAEQGFPWQGRYTLPLAVGIPILAALQIDQARTLPDGVVRRLGGLLLGLFVVGQLYAHFWATRRYTAGVNGTLNWLTAGGWKPPIPVWALFAGFLAVVPALAAWFYLVGNRPTDDALADDALAEAA